MKETNTNESLFDEIFKQELADKASQVPAGAWEGISSSIGGSAAGAAAGAGKLALWFKIAIAVGVAGTALFVYDNISDKPAEKTSNEVQVLNTDVQTEEPVTQKGTEIQATESAVPEHSQKVEPVREKVDDGSVANDPVTEPGEGNEFKFKMPELNNSNPYKMPEPAKKPENIKKADNPQPVKNDTVVLSKDPLSQKSAGDNDSSFIMVPNVFTPDGDGVNDGYLIQLVNEEMVDIIIFNSDNTIIFRTSNKYQAWNGKLPNGELAPAGPYYTVKVVYKFKGKSIETTGTRLTILK